MLNLSLEWLKTHLLARVEAASTRFSSGRVAQRVVDLLVMAAIAIVLVYGRWASIVFPFPLNPDEAQAAANALRIRSYGFNWNVLDGSTNGPLDSLVTCWPYLFGWDVTMSTMRLTAYVLLILVCLFVYLSAKALCGRGYAALIVLPLVLFYAFTMNPNYLHYSSELLPLTLLVAANYIVVRISVSRTLSNRFRYAAFMLAGLLLGAVPFAKIQGAPIAVVIALYAFVLAVTDPYKGRLRNSIALICGGLAPACGFLLPLLISGHIQDFWQSYIAWSFLYVKTPLPLSGIHGMLAGDLELRYVSYFVFSLVLASLLHVYIAVPDKEKPGRVARYDVIYGLVLLITAFWVIAKPGNYFAHYLMFFPPFAVMLCAHILRAFVHKRKQGLLFTAYYAALAAIFIGLFVNSSLTERVKHPRGVYDTMLHQSLDMSSPHLLSWLPIPATHLLVWGWMPEWYVLSDLTPASRESNTFLQTDKSALQGYFRSRFMSDISASSPDIIMDAVEGKSFYYTKAWQAGPATFPDFSKYLSSNYVQLKPWRSHDDCPKLYVKNEYKTAIDRRLIVPASVTTSADYLDKESPFIGANLFDNSVTEDTCIDYWLLPNWKTGSVDVKFQKMEPVSKLMILNTRNGGYLDRATDRIDVKLLKSGAIVNDRQIAMRTYPYWTSIDLDKPMDADELKVSILSFLGRGGGLNEIKIFRPAEPAADGTPGGSSGAASPHR